MKTTTIGRIGAIVAGAAMLGTAVASAFAGAVDVPATLDKGFFISASGAPNVQIVVGEKAQASDGAAAGQIAAVIGNMAFTTTTASADGGTAQVAAESVTCSGGEVACDAGSAEGMVKLSWESVGMNGELEQREMDCDIYQSGSEAMILVNMTNGGDEGDWADDDTEMQIWDEEGNDDWEDDDEYVEIYTPQSVLATTLVGSCEVEEGAVSILKDGEFANEICTICYNYCDIALGCEPHFMSEWVEIYGGEMVVEYDCEDAALKYTIIDEGAITYNVFTDDILTEDILDDDDALVGQSYMGKMILGQHEYYVEDLDDDSVTIVCGDTGTATTTTAMEYIAPAVGSACDAEDSGDAYSIKLVGAQTIEEKGVVDVTLQVTHNGETEEVTSGISGTPIVDDIKIKLQRGTAASNVITGDQSFSADLLVWYVPSEYTFFAEASSEDNEGLYDEMGVAVEDGDLDEVRAAWRLQFNGHMDNGDFDELTVADVEALEEDDLLQMGEANISMPDDIEENAHWEDCYEDAAEADQAATIVRNMRFTLAEMESDQQLTEGELIQLPFNDGKYLLSDLKFGYMGLLDEQFRDWDMQDKTVVEVNVNEADVYNDTEEELQSLRTAVTIDFVDEDGNSWSDVRVDEGPFTGDETILYGDEIMQLEDLDYDEDNTLWNVTYVLWDGDEWTDANGGDEYYVELTEANEEALVDSQVQDMWITTEFSFTTDLDLDTNEGVWPDGSTWYVDEGEDSLTHESQGRLYIDVDDTAIPDLNGVEFQLVSGFDINTEFDDLVLDGGWTYYDDGTINISMQDYIETTILGQTDAGAEDTVFMYLDDSDLVWNETNGSFTAVAGALMDEAEVFLGDDEANVYCGLNNEDCEEIATGEIDGTLLTLSGALVDVTGSSDIEEPEDSGNDEEADTLSSVVMTIPENELRPTIFFGIESSTNSSSVTITEADVGTIVPMGGLDVTVEEFGVTTSAGSAVVTGGATAQCPAREASCQDVTYTTLAPANIGYSLVVLDSAADSSKNLVLIGGPAVNAMTEGLVTAADLCESAKIMLSGSKLVVAGCEAEDTMSAAQSLVSWLKAL